jgi:hypothetical protein
MSSKVASYYDWSLAFKKTPKDQLIDTHDYKRKNSIGLDPVEFKSFLKNWKKDNL